MCVQNSNYPVGNKTIVPNVIERTFQFDFEKFGNAAHLNCHTTAYLSYCQTAELMRIKSRNEYSLNESSSIKTRCGDNFC